MKTINIFIALVLLMTTLPQITKAQGGISAGVRQHTLHSVFTELPFKDDDLTYTLGYEYHDKNGYWQFMVGYTPEIDNTEIEIGDIEVDYVITPQLNLVIRDGIFLAGTGILASYIESTEDSDWTDVYWQLMLGLEIPIGAIRLELLAYYPFDSWGNVDEFDSDDIEYGGSFKYLF